MALFSRTINASHAAMRHIIQRTTPIVTTCRNYQGLNHVGETQMGSEKAHVVDMRSDCLTRSSDAMRKAMSRATMGDDVFNEDPTVHELQRKVAEMFGMEDTLFVPSGTMGNLISVMVHCDRRGLEVLFGSMSHLVMYEQGGVAQFGGIMSRIMPNKPDGTYDLDAFDSYIRPLDDPHQPFTGLVTIENTHGNCGGKAIPLDFLAKLREKANQHAIPVHMDGARVINAAVSLGVDVQQILKQVDTVSLCLSKGIGAPIGSIIGGPAEFIAKSRRLRKALGGGWRQPGPLAAAALVALEDCTERLATDHKHARMFADGVMAEHNNIVNIDMAGLHTNIVMVDILKPELTAVKLCERLNMVTDAEFAALGERITIKSMAFYKHTSRFLLCHNNPTSDVEAAVKKFQYVLQEQAAQC